MSVTGHAPSMPHQRQGGAAIAHAGQPPEFSLLDLPFIGAILPSAFDDTRTLADFSFRDSSMVERVAVNH